MSGFPNTLGSTQSENNKYYEHLLMVSPKRFIFSHQPIEMTDCPYRIYPCITRQVRGETHQEPLCESNKD